MKLYKYTLLLFVLLGLFACNPNSDDPKDSRTDQIETENPALKVGADYTNVIHGRLIVKVRPESKMDVSIGKSGDFQLNNVPTLLQQTFSKIGVKSVKPLFPDYDEFKERRIAEGLDRWMIITFEESYNTPEAASLMSKTREFEFVELDYMLEHPSVSIYPNYPQARASQNDNMQFPANDALLPLQWNYHNTGKFLDSVKGADINLFEAWTQTKGNKDVVVCVVDGGIDYNHEDLRDNFDFERSRNFIFDDEGNYKDKDIYPDPDGHGTHVAGIIGAVTNNGIGISGIAGGDGTKGSGVTIINAQVLGNRREVSAGGAAGIVWGADHGAVISQNSWGYRYPGPVDIPEHDKEAIEYFIKHAGKDKNGKQLSNSPMSGGIVIFAAGNDGMDYKCWPGAYENCVSVSSMAWDFTAALYSNRGNWIDIMAPGGDQIRFGQKGGILSTVPKKVDSSGYAYMQGTSMACPHVSGVAALIVSKYGGQGFTNEDLKKMLLSSVRPYDINKYNPKYLNRLGVGYIDAGAAVEEDKNISPDTPNNLHLKDKPGYNDVVLAWEVSSDKDAPSKTSKYYYLYVSDKQITNENRKDAKLYKVYSEDKPLGAAIEQRVTKLQDDTQYFIQLLAVDRFGHASAPANLEIKTKRNNAPEVTEGLPEKELIIPSVFTQELLLKIIDKDNHKWVVKKGGDLRGVSIIHLQSENEVKITINPVQPEGNYSFDLILEDEYGKSNIYKIPYKLVKYHKPTVVANINNLVIGLDDQQVKLPIDNIFSYVKEVALDCQVISSDESKLTAQIEGEYLILNPKAIGTSKLRIEGSDGFNSIETKLDVRVVNDSKASVYLVYPIPAKTELNVVLNKDIKRATFVVTSLRGEVLLREEKTIGINHQVSLDVHKLVAGTYSLTVVSSKGTYRTSFLKH